MAEYYATVATGLEWVAEEEIREQGAEETERWRGKVWFASEQPPEVLLRLRSVENLYAFVARVEGIPLDASGLERLRRVPLEVEWEPALNVWRRFFPAAPARPSFRVTARRAGQHMYRSPGVAAAIGDGVVQRFGWPVRLTEYDLEIVAHLTEDVLLLGLTLTPESLYRRHRAVLGRTALKPSIAYAMARLTRIQAGEVLMDPMCGVGTIPIEAALAWPEAFHLAGERAPVAVERAAINIRHAGARVLLLRWDARRLPLASESVDAIACDMPFGRRMGSHRQNLYLYPPVLREMARVLRSGGRAVLLTLEKRLMRRCLQRIEAWGQEAVYTVNVGGLEAGLYCWRKR